MYFKDQTYSIRLAFLSLTSSWPAIPPRYTVMHAHIHKTPAPASAPTSSEFPHAPISPFLHQQPATAAKRARNEPWVGLFSYWLNRSMPWIPTANERLG